MKKLQLQFILSCFLILFTCGSAFSVGERFRSITSGNWNATTTWEMSTNNGSTWIPATLTPNETSGLINVRFPNTVTVTVNVSADQLTIDSGSVSINTAIVFTLLNGAGEDFLLLRGGTVTGLGTFQTQGVGTEMNLRNGSNFNAALKINTGTTTVNEQSSPFTARLFGTLTVDAGATIFLGSGTYFLEVYKAIVNNGTITGSSATLILKGVSLANNNSITVSNLRVDSTSSISGAGTFTSSTISISSTANLSLTSNVTFSPLVSFTINTGGTVNLNTRTLNFNSGTFEVNNTATVTSNGLFQTQGTIALDLKPTSQFNAPLKINSGTTTANNQASPFDGRLYGPITVDNGAVLSVGSGGYDLEAYNTVTNNGTIAGTGGTVFALRGASLVNNGIVNCRTFRMDSVSTLSGAGSFTSNIIQITSGSIITLLSDVTFSPVVNFTISGGTLNPNTRTLTFTSGEFEVTAGATVSNSGLVRTQGTVALNLDGGTNFNAPLKVNTGTTTANDQSSPFIGRLFGTVTVDNGAALSVGTGGYTLEAYENVTNNGTITGTSSTVFALRGPAMVNNGSINCRTLRMDSVATLSGTGTFTNNSILITSGSNITLLNDITFSPLANFTITGGTLNPNTHTFTFTNGEFGVTAGGIVTASGLVRTQGTIALNLDALSTFNAPLLVNSGTTTANDLTSPFIGRVYGAITVNASAILSVGNGSYTLEIYSNLTNNGTVSGTGDIDFTSGIHTLTGNGAFTADAFVLNGSTVNLTSNHQFNAVTVNIGGTFNIGSNSVKFKAVTPLVANGTFTNVGSKIEYNGTSLQSVPTVNVNYYTLRINNPGGAFLTNNISIPDSLNVILGDLSLNGKIITIQPSGYMTETPGNVVFGSTGHIITTRNVGAPSSNNVGGLGAVLTSAVNLGVTEVRRAHTVQTGLNGGTSIKRYYDITPTTNTGLNATLVYKFDDSELNGKPEPSLKLFKSTNAGVTWLFMGGNVNIALNQITLTGLTSFSRWSADSSKVSAAIGLIQEGFYNVATNNLNMTDTVRAYLRNTTNPFAIVDSAKGLLDSLTFKSGLQFNNAPTGTYYIQLKHRNSLETWSKNGVNYIQDSTLNYDFTFAATQAFGNNEIQKGTKFCLYSGDVTQDGFIDLTDVIMINNNATNFVTGYVNTDANGNSIVDLTDVLIAYNNSINFVVKKTPLNP